MGKNFSSVTYQETIFFLTQLHIEDFNKSFLGVSTAWC